MAMKTGAENFGHSTRPSPENEYTIQTQHKGNLRLDLNALDGWIWMVCKNRDKHRIIKPSYDYMISQITYRLCR